ncbi:hypothetical protein BCL57_002668 [Agromyces flavus]|uniref:DUF4395 domain-containing protein n=1 Tax=Agromyces flavus TaxID=589382 RepID=A0A1H1T3Z2_9MICO|nr:DUF4395 domain-containing protein [Agromyces flavus]MCP2368495.1 hypothetical protein [Agromyces flavus]GGI47955.1 hypothetical protein GCM10010932_26430 [Agromyces flavus]SDS54935.1 protein of unknown function [Agromyces flavus]
MSPTTPERARSGIDARGPRFTAAITAVLLLATAVLGFGGLDLAALLLLTAITAVFAWSAVAGVARNPFGLVFRALIRPRLAPPSELEDPRPPTFAQLVGFLVTGTGVVLGLVGVTAAVPIAAALAFVAAFLNAAFGFCLGCQLYLLLVRARVIRAA